MSREIPQHWTMTQCRLDMCECECAKREVANRDKACLY